MSLSKVAEPLANLLVSERVLNVFIHGISGALAGSISTLSLYPIENVKTRLQALAKQEEKTTTDGGPEPEKKKKNKKLDEMIVEVFQKEGVKGFYKGVFPYFLGTLASFGVYFFWYEFFKAFFIGEKFSVPGYTATALCAGWITTTVTNPIWVVHTRVLLEKDRAVGLIETFKNVLKHEGIEGLFKGIGAGYVLVLNPIVQFLVYEFLKKKFEKTQYQTAMVFLAGAISKTIATLVTYPYQTMKTNLQANKSKNMSQAELIKMILKNKGIQGFFNGLSAKLSQTVINSALMLVIYERLQVFVKQLLVFLLTKR